MVRCMSPSFSLMAAGAVVGPGRAQPHPLGGGLELADGRAVVPRGRLALFLPIAAPPIAQPEDAGLDVGRIVEGHRDLPKLAAIDHVLLDLLREAHGARIELVDRKSTRLNSSHITISYAVFCLKKKK